MKDEQIDFDETTLSIDLSDATQAVKESRFEDALSLLRVLLKENPNHIDILYLSCLLYTSPSPRDRQKSRMPSSA